VSVIDWGNAAHDAPQFAGAMLVVGALTTMALLPVRPRTEARDIDAVIVRIAFVGAVGAVAEAATYGVVERFGAALMAAVYHMDRTVIERVPAPPAETMVRFLAIATSFAALLVAARLRSGAVRRTVLALGWGGALTDVALAAQRVFFSGRWRALIHPIHVIAAGVWIGTLAVIFVAMAVPWRRLPSAPAAFVGEVIKRFSPLAMASSGALALTGILAASARLHALQEMWTTSYGQVLVAKLGFTGVVMLCGAWNWRRLVPTLSDTTAPRWQTAGVELASSAIVIALAAVLVSIRA
jgi:putative copper export protein